MVMVGDKINNWTILEKLKGNKFKCQCVCGTIKLVTACTVKSGESASCGCVKRLQTSNRCMIDMSTVKFNHCVVLRRLDKIGERKDRKTLWECKCECGNIFTRKGIALRKNANTSCGCVLVKKLSLLKVKDIAGNKYGMLLVLARSGTTPTGQATWRCRCDCGNIIVTEGRSLRLHRSESCGCQSLGHSLVSLKFLEFLEKTYSIVIQKGSPSQEFSIENKRFDGRYKNTLIETDGIYWHGTPEAKQNDDYKTKLAEENGFNLIRVQYLDTEKQIQPLYEKYKDQFDKAFSV